MGGALHSSRSISNTVFSPTGAPTAEQPLCEVDPPSMDEVCTASGQMRNYWTPGEDGIPGETDKTCLKSLGPWLHLVISEVWMSETVTSN